jgi:hypothetical protein
VETALDEVSAPDTFAPDDFAQLFRPSGQVGLFDRPLEEIEPRWIRA